jgi:hypothetical protein
LRLAWRCFFDRHHFFGRLGSGSFAWRRFLDRLPSADESGKCKHNGDRHDPQQWTFHDLDSKRDSKFAADGKGTKSSMGSKSSVDADPLLAHSVAPTGMRDDRRPIIR